MVKDGGFAGAVAAAGRQNGVRGLSRNRWLSVWWDKGGRRMDACTNLGVGLASARAGQA